MTITNDTNGTELLDLVADPIKRDDPILNSSGRDLESGELIVVPQGGGKSSTYCCGLIRTPFQCVPACGSCVGLGIDLIAAIIIIADQFLMQGDENQQAMTVNTIFGAVLFVAGTLVMLTSCGSFWLIRHYKPEKDLEGQLDDFERENVKLKIENQGLNDNAERLEGILLRYQQMLEKQNLITDQLKTTLDERVNGLRFEREQLQLLAQNYEIKVQDGMKQFQSGTQQAKELSEKLAVSNRELREKLQALDVNVEGLAEQEKEWEQDLAVLSGENDEFKNHNFELQRLGKILNNQLLVIQKLTASLALKQDGLKVEVDRLDEVDDNLVKVSDNLLKAVEEKDHQLQEAELRIVQLMTAMAQFREAILLLRKTDLQNVESCEILFQPLLDILDDASDKSIDKSDSLLDDE
jgi:hypothetical protein